MKVNQGLESLDVWQKSVDFAVAICQNVLPLFPDEEKWALSSQLRRSVQSAPANIAEGYGRYNFQESIRFCYIARGSMAETKTHLIIAHRLSYIDNDLTQIYLSQLNELGKMLHGYIAHLRKMKQDYKVKESSDHDDEYTI